jgi:hypothetical protein
LIAATAAVERLRQREGDLDVAAASVDDEQEAVELLAAFRAAVAGEMRDSESVIAARQALRRVFHHFVLHRELETIEEPTVLETEKRFRSIFNARLFLGDIFLEPIPREDAIVRPWVFDQEGNVITFEQLRKVALSSEGKPNESAA